ncbi:hypothetical protein E2R59_12200 [Kocuria rosea]|uniref:Uncharacterized protein n=1 Tax=Kocuria rosea TaxID=1275 RepID=A0A4R5YF36_KOCRO|nr:hypothetical protein E2R59_12200 [Kocuria rosea]
MLLVRVRVQGRSRPVARGGTRYHLACAPVPGGTRAAARDCCDGLTRSVLLGARGPCSSEGSPVMAGSTP